MAQVLTDIKERLKAGRRTMKDLAEATGIPYTSVNSYLNGFTGIPTENYQKISNQLDAWDNE